MGSLTELAKEIDQPELTVQDGTQPFTPSDVTVHRHVEAEVPEYVPASADVIREALTGGGRAVVSVRSQRSGKHVTIVLYCRKQKEGERGYVSRATAAGRVGLSDAYCVEARAEDMEYPDNYVGRLYLPDGPRWRAGKQADALRTWTAEKVLSFALGGYPLDHQADVFIATSCSYCGKRLTDPVSVERGVGPECYGRATGSKVAH
jgi:hypothetical protein